MGKENHLTSTDQLPLVLRVDDVAAVLRISRATAYALVNEVGFPSIRVGRRIVIPKRAFLNWLGNGSV